MRLWLSPGAFPMRRAIMRITAVLIALEGQEVLVPAVWPLEVTECCGGGATAEACQRTGGPALR